MSRTTPRQTPHDPGADAPNYRRFALLAVGAALSISLAGYAMSSAASTEPAPTGDGFAASGTAIAGDVIVDGAEVAMGDVPLDVTVTPTWTLTNTGQTTVTLGDPHATVNEGCCPGPLSFDRTDLAPGASATLSFPLQMHPGMDGAHDFDIHVPVDDDAILTLGVTGNFG